MSQVLLAEAGERVQGRGDEALPACTAMEWDSTGDQLALLPRGVSHVLLYHQVRPPSLALQTESARHSNAGSWVCVLARGSWLTKVANRVIRVWHGATGNNGPCARDNALTFAAYE
jgi:hypothetical protein